MHKVLGAQSAAQHRLGLQGLIQTISGDGKPVDRYGEMIYPHSLRIANSLWPAEGYQLSPSFVADAEKLYHAQAQPIDVKDPQGSADKINAWVLEATADKIKDLVSPADVNDLTRMILVNAVHFLGRWQEPFFESNTSDLPFYVQGKGKGVPVPTMVRGHYFKSLDNDEVTIAEMTYWSTSDDNQMVMTLIVPKKRDGLTALEAKLSPELLSDWISHLDGNTMVSIYLPKWKAETTAELSGTLSTIGLAPLFGATADLSGISAEEGLQVSAVVHKTYISVDEKGTEAAAATSIMMAGSAPQEPIDLRADHPFLYLIRDANSGTILFIGRVVDPR
jgi:serpin B